jgi:hypothetical protein
VRVLLLLRLAVATPPPFVPGGSSFFAHSRYERFEKKGERAQDQRERRYPRGRLDVRNASPRRARGSFGILVGVRDDPRVVGCAATKGVHPKDGRRHARRSRRRGCDARICRADERVRVLFERGHAAERDVASQREGAELGSSLVRNQRVCPRERAVHDVHQRPRRPIGRSRDVRAER